MKNYWYKTGMLTLGLLALSGCSATNNNQSVSETSTASSSVVESVAVAEEQSNDSVIKEIPNDTTRYEKFIVREHLDYDKVFVGDNNDMASDPRYADITPDGKINWQQNSQGEDRQEVLQFLEQVTINGKPIRLPLTFAELDPAYAAFDTLNLHNVTEENLNMTFENASNSKRISFDEQMTAEEWFALVKITHENVNEIYVSILVDNFKPVKIVGLDSVFGDKYNSSADLRVAGIGVGNTFNEMYEVFGEPSTITRLGDATHVYYELGNEYTIGFSSLPRITNPFTGELSEVYGNVITGVHVLKYEE